MYQQNNQLGDIALRIDDLRRVIERQASLTLNFYDAFKQRWISYTGQIESLKELLGKISAPQSDADALAKLEKLNAQFNTAIENYGHLAPTTPNADSKPLSVQSGAIFSSRKELEGKLVGLASDEAKNSGWWSDRCTTLSYYLYFTGWLLAVVGKALNVRGMELPSPGS
jgi:hypothetical protein